MASILSAIASPVDDLVGSLVARLNPMGLFAHRGPAQVPTPSNASVPVTNAGAPVPKTPTPVTPATPAPSATVPPVAGAHPTLQRAQNPLLMETQRVGTSAADQTGRDQDNLTRLQNSQPGVDQFAQKHKIIGDILRGLDIAGSVLAPGISELVPGTTLHHDWLLKRADNQLNSDTMNQGRINQAAVLAAEPQLKAAQLGDTLNNGNLTPMTTAELSPLQNASMEHLAAEGFVPVKIQDPKNLGTPAFAMMNKATGQVFGPNGELIPNAEPFTPPVKPIAATVNGKSVFVNPVTGKVEHPGVKPQLNYADEMMPVAYAKALQKPVEDWNTLDNMTRFTQDSAISTQNQLLQSVTPLLSTILIPTSAGNHRLNQTELSQLAPGGLSLGRTVLNGINKYGMGHLPPVLIAETIQLGNMVRANAFGRYLGELKANADNFHQNGVTVVSPITGENISIPEAEKELKILQQRAQMGPSQIMSVPKNGSGPSYILLGFGKSARWVPIQ